MNLENNCSEEETSRNIRLDTSRDILLKEFHGRIPPDYYEKPRFLVQRIWHQKRFQLIKNMLKDLNLKKNNILGLDVGCNGGTFTEIIRKSIDADTIIGVDINEEGVRYAAKKYHEIHFLVADACNLPFRENSFDFITCLEVLEHLKEPLKGLLEIRRCLKSEHGAILLVPCPNSLLFKIVWRIWLKTGGKVWKETHTDVFINEEDLNLSMQRANLKIIKKKKSHLRMLIAFIVKKYPTR